MQRAGGRRTFSSTPDEGRSSTSRTTGGEEEHIFKHRHVSISVAPIIKHPDVAGGLRGGEVEIAGLDVVGRRGSRRRTETRLVQVEDGTRRPHRTFGRRIDPLDKPRLRATTGAAATNDVQAGY